MLFSSLQFIFLFLPFTLAGYYGLIYFGKRDWIFLFLVFASLVFYSVWNPPYVFLLIGSVLGNYVCGKIIQTRAEKNKSNGLSLLLGTVGNLAILGWFKYANFFVDNVNAVTSTQWTLDNIILPLAISFYTFQQIAYLVDIARGEVKAGGIWRYATFVIFFPQLIAGPIVHYKEMMPQFFGRNLGRFWRADLAVGLTIFAIGLFKKTVIADSAATFASPVFDAAHAGQPIDLLMGWKAASCYTIQLYFDFSGYSDMAIGLARMFGIRLPVNFHSPLRAGSIIEYWRRWHITLQHFIVNYMYQPLVLPLARFSVDRGYGKWGSFFVTVAAPTVLVFIIIGLWHGSAWTFVLFGLMHGTYLAVNECWRLLMRKKRRRGGGPGQLTVTVYYLITLACVVLANVMFRAVTPQDAWTIWAAMFQINQITGAWEAFPGTLAEVFSEPFLFVLCCVFIVALAPNTQQLLSRYRPVLEWERWRKVALPVIPLTWRPTALWAVWTGIVLFLGIAFISRAQTEFIYFNF
ncbi:MBOAT family O-acyltransferase [Roseibium aggregatum]|uniref:Probable alginate O-acetylase AlgI n=1 Tax=Roseibium aggregatum TaxID=187304 RepID=A0A939EC46_9HYPH|nr:MBOAT family O-acyltransferase [Roseibium aggregatum]MBN9669877.1 MBOAT family protein [Roseibium aggregatum]